MTMIHSAALHRSPWAAALACALAFVLCAAAQARQPDQGAAPVPDRSVTPVEIEVQAEVPAVVQAPQAAFAATVQPGEAAAAAPVRLEGADPADSRIGEATTALLELQRSGAQASPTRRAVLPAVASLNYARYLESFKHPLPEFFESTGAVKSGGGSGGGGRCGGAERRKARWPA
ncbi:DUF3613 domain-containing protein [Xylophilus sp.]|uniref:DUF3613 domain-containing protein n=1 Tax=Xylophilus sp. TaxID=2653893 RepID=UPI002D80CB15|nr:DUF3613 domain-containing protein [Xylophilus sp.]